MLIDRSSAVTWCHQPIGREIASPSD